MTKRCAEVITYYVAVDGTEFFFAPDCAKYEYELFIKDRAKAADRLKIKDVDLYPPVCVGEHKNVLFNWYKVEDIFDFELLNNAYFKELDKVPVTYPEIIGVEVRLDTHSAARSYLLSDIIKDLRSFCDKFGYEIKKKK